LNLLTILFIAVGLAMDAFAVSIANGLVLKKEKLLTAFKLGLFFGGFQALMPILGWYGGSSFRDIIAGYDHWLAFGLLVFIGGKMIYESFKLKELEESPKALTYTVLLILAVATSIDALAVGLSFAFLSISIVTPVIIIGLVSFVLSFIGVFIGNKLGHFFERKIEIIGGLILIGIGVKTLVEHLIG
jgi:manganese efflux pump family protein